MAKRLSTENKVGGNEGLTRGHKKKARTRQLLIDAALRIYARKGSAYLALNELADEAGFSNGTIYNYFRTREDVLQAVGLALAEQLSHQVTALSVGLASGAERLSVGIRIFVLHAQQDPEWASALVSVVRYAEGMRSALAAQVRSDLQTGQKQGDLSYLDEDMALNLVVSSTLGAMSAITEGHIAERHDSIIAEMVLLALGVAQDKALRVAWLPMPDSMPMSQSAPERLGTHLPI